MHTSVLFALCLVALATALTAPGAPNKRKGSLDAEGRAKLKEFWNKAEKDIPEGSARIAGRHVPTGPRNNVTAHDQPIVLYLCGNDGQDKKTKTTPALAKQVTDADGHYVFDIEHPNKDAWYQACVQLPHGEFCAHHHVRNEDSGRHRRDLSTVTLPSPQTLSSDECEIHLAWSMNSNTYHCDWDTCIVCPYDSCIAAWNDAGNYGYCEDSSDSTFTTYTTIYDNSDCIYDSYGFEDAIIRHGPSGTHDYHHFTYAYDTSASFEHSGSHPTDAIVKYYKRNPTSGLTVLELQVDLEDANDDEEDARFWHSGTVQFVGGTPDSFTETNTITCTPEDSTGSTATIGVENGARGC